MKKEIRLILASLAVLLLTACGQEVSIDSNYVNFKINSEISFLLEDINSVVTDYACVDETVYVTAFTKSLMDAVTDDDNKKYLMPGNFESEVSRLSNRSELSFPKIEVNNYLEEIKYTELYGVGNVYTLSSDSDYDKIVLYIHGGAGIYNINEYQISFLDKLASAVDAKIYMPLYPLAPQGSYEEIYELLEDVYKDLLNQDKEVILMGDSAGGVLVLGFTEYLDKNGINLPDKQILISGCVDATLSNPDIDEYEEKDILLATYGCRKAAELLMGDLDKNDYRVRPVYGDLSNMPPTMLIVGTDEIMYPDNLILYDRLKQENRKVKLVTGKGLCHVYALFPVTEAQKTFNSITNFIGK